MIDITAVLSDAIPIVSEGPNVNAKGVSSGYFIVGVPLIFITAFSIFFLNRGER